VDGLTVQTAMEMADNKSNSFCVAGKIRKPAEVRLADSPWQSGGVVISADHQMFWVFSRSLEKPTLSI